MFTFIFLMVILGITDRRAPAGFAPLGIGLCLTLIHLVTHPDHQHLGEPGPVDRPGALHRRRRRSKQLWLFIVAPIAGAVLAALAHRFIAGQSSREPPAEIA